MKNILYPLRTLRRRLHLVKKISAHKKRREMDKRLKSKNVVYLIGTPEHGNLGDSAITIAEILFIKRYLKSDVQEITFNEFYTFKDVIKKRLSGKQVFCQGGGNIGNQFYWEEQFRYELMDALPAANITIFPQSIYFLPDSDQDINRSVSYYNNRKDLIMTARDRHSYKKMRELYPNTKILFAPDIVLSTTMADYGVGYEQRRCALFCLRSDAEKSVSDRTWIELEAFLQEKNYPIVHTDTDIHMEKIITNESRWHFVCYKMREFCKAKIVITDRLHGMIFAAQTETPCVVFSNYNHKIREAYDWIRYLPYIRYAETAEDAKNQIEELTLLKDCHFDNSPLQPYFEAFAEILRHRTDILA